MKICEEIVENANKREHFFCLVSYIICIINLEIKKLNIWRPETEPLYLLYNRKNKKSRVNQYSILS